MSTDRNIAVFASGGGGLFRAILSGQQQYSYKVIALVSDRHCGAVELALENGVEVIALAKGLDNLVRYERVTEVLKDRVKLLVLAGYMPILPREFCIYWRDRIINSHPSLLPAYGGKGMYGVRVQEALINDGVKMAGCTIHYVNEGIDTGDAIVQKRVEVISGESAWDLGGRIHAIECELYPRTIQSLLDGLDN